MSSGRTAFTRLLDTPLNVTGFDGSLELLLHLIDQGKLEVTSVALLAVADQYQGFLRQLPLESQRLECLAEFLVVGAQLLLLKSRALLPREHQHLEEADVDDPEALAARLEEYRRYRLAAGRLRERQETGRRAYSRTASPPLPPVAPPPPLELTSPDLLARALQRIIAARPPAPPLAAPPRVTISERVAEVRQVLAERGSVPFAWLAEGCASRTDLIITFLAILELHRFGALVIQQADLFGEIWLSRSDQSDAAAGDPAAYTSTEHG